MKNSAAAKLIGTRVALQPSAARFAIGATTGQIIAAATTASGWQEGGQVRVLWRDGEKTWEPIAGLRNMSGGDL